MVPPKVAVELAALTVLDVGRGAQRRSRAGHLMPERNWFFRTYRAVVTSSSKVSNTDAAAQAAPDGRRRGGADSNAHRPDPAVRTSWLPADHGVAASRRVEGPAAAVEARAPLAEGRSLRAATTGSTKSYMGARHRGGSQPERPTVSRAERGRRVPPRGFGHSCQCRSTSGVCITIPSSGTPPSVGVHQHQKWSRRWRLC